MTAVPSGLEASLPMPGALPASGMQCKMNYTREPAQAKMPPAKPVKPRHRSTATDGHFDPDELSRRLYLVMADQRAHSERKRRARAEVAKAKEMHQLSTGDGVPAAVAAVHAPRPSEMSTDLISELRRQKSQKMSAQRKPSKLALVTSSTSSSSKPTAESSLQYHHVPREAAKQFTRTTTVEGMREPSLVHKLSEQALKFHFGARPSHRSSHHRAVQSDPNVTLSAAATAPQRGRSQREKTHGHTQVQHTQIPEETVEEDAERGKGTELRQRHTLQAGPSRAKVDMQQLDPRRNSTGDVLRKTEHSTSALVDPTVDLIDEMTPGEEPLERQIPPEPKVDWTQSDEIAQRHKPLLSPLLRKADSIWTLRGRLGSKGSSSHEKGGGGGCSNPQNMPETLKSPRSGFFAKFKR